MTKEIPLTHGYAALVDDEDYDMLMQWKWQCNSYGYATRVAYLGGGWRREIRQVVAMHRLIMGNPEGMEIDHIDRNPLNNTRQNLRICTHAQNKGNNKLYSIPNKSSQYRGVTFSKKKNKWVAQIRAHGQSKFLGHFTSEADAARAYDKAAIEAHGDFANPNFPQESEK